jgi:hypothetical protein
MAKVKVVFKDIGLEGVDWIYLAMGRDHSQAVMNTVMNLQFP